MKYLHNDAEAEDMTMQIFEKLIQELKKHHITTFKPWLHMVVKNECMMRFRKASTDAKKDIKLKFELNKNVESEAVDHLQEAEDKKQEAQDKEFVLRYLKEGIDELKEEQRMCIELFYMKEATYSEIVNVTGFSMNEVKSHLQNGKRNLKKFITAKNDEAENGKNEIV